jgi:hypothetical protein
MFVSSTWVSDGIPVRAADIYHTLLATVSGTCQDLSMDLSRGFSWSNANFFMGDGNLAPDPFAR